MYQAKLDTMIPSAFQGFNDKERFMKILSHSFGGARLELLFSSLITITEPHCGHLIDLSGFIFFVTFAVFPLLTSIPRSNLIFSKVFLAAALKNP